MQYIGCPALIRMDHGTDNGLIGTTHIAFRSQQNDELSGANSFRYGKSPANVVSSIVYTCTYVNVIHFGKAGGPSYEDTRLAGGLIHLRCWC